MFWLLFGAFLYLLIKNQFDMQGVKKDARKIAKAIMKALQGAGKTIHNAVDEAKKQKAEKAVAQAVRQAAEAVQAAPAQPAPEVRAATVSPETRENNQLLKDLEQHSSIAAMLANVPVLNFPEDDPKYDSSRKYNYA